MSSIRNFGIKTAMLSLLIILSIFSCSKDDPAGPSGEWVWSSLGSGINDRVFAFKEYNGNLIVGGYFDTAGGIAISNIAAWNDTAWSALGAGLNGEVAALTIYDGKLIAGGTFTTAGGVAANYIAAWDGSTWTALGTGMNGRVRALGVYYFPEGHQYHDFPLLIAGGEFTQAGSNNLIHNLAAWDGNNWGWPSVNADGPVHAICETADGPLYIGGDFVVAGNNTCNGIFLYDYSAVSMGHGMTLDNDEAGTVFAVLEHDNKIYAGGIFDSASGIPVNNVAVFSATTGWRACASGLEKMGGTADIRALTSFDNKIIAGGYFTKADGDDANYIASWNGTKWSSLGLGVDGDYWPHVWALAVYNNKLYAGGRFTTAGGDSAANIAAWHFVPD